MAPWDEALISSLPTIEPDPKGGRVLGYVQALHEALTLALEKFPEMFVMGQGVDDPGGMFGTTKDLHLKFGSHRVFDTPLSEECMTGVCVGSAMRGMRPMLMHNRPDFILLSMNQLVNHASKYTYMDNGQTRVPMVIWAAIGRGWGSGAQHSQAIQGLLLGVPGLKIIMPSNPHDAKGLLLSAIEDNNPVLIFEHRWLMKQKGIVPEGYYKVPIGKAVFRRVGTDLTIVSASQTLDLAVQAVDQLKAEGITADVIDLRTLKPLDETAILTSLKKTGKLLVLDTGWAMAGLCAEIGCIAAEKGFEYLKAPVRRIALPDIPTPAGFTLEQFIYPDLKRVVTAIREMCRGK